MKYLLSFLVALATLTVSAQTTYNRPFDILHTHLAIDLTQHSQSQITGVATHELEITGSGVTSLDFDLLQLTVDSIWVDGVLANSAYDDTLLSITPPATLGQGDTIEVAIKYHGSPSMDASGWGGFYFSGGIAFNLGVGFAADPHNFGRAWYPCVDTFTEKSIYTFAVTTLDNEMAICNGLLDSEIDNGDGTNTWTWELNQPLPSYLVSVAVGPYTVVKDQYQGIQNSYPIWLAAKPGDTTDLKKSFVHLPDALEAFENAYGPQPFDRVGYVLVPFNGGAMEHASNIAYPQSTANGTTAFETLMAHELAHHWWGDYMTCSSAEEMWLNEGWAVYSEHLFLEHVYGRKAYDDEVQTNHNYVLYQAHIADQDFRALDDIPHAFTYGAHSYQKGADVAHTLRAYLGETQFFDCITGFLQQYSFANASSMDFMNYLTTCSGKDMGPFFDTWVFNPGFPHFSIDSVKSTEQNGQYNVSVYIRQRKYEVPNYANQVPLQLFFYEDSDHVEVKDLTMTGRCGIYHATLSFDPVFVGLDLDRLVSDAVSDEVVTLSGTGSSLSTSAFLDFLSYSVPVDSEQVYIAHHWVAPDPMLDPIPNLHLSERRYWEIDGTFSGTLQGTARVRYNGTTNQQGNLDNDLITNSEDSLVLLYRSGAGQEWEEYDSYQVRVLGSPTDKSGYVDITGLKKGEYALAIYDANRTPSGISDIPSNCVDLNTYAPPAPRALQRLSIQPNPATDTIQVSWDYHMGKAYIEVVDLSGQSIYRGVLAGNESKTVLNASSWAAGTYLIKLMVNNDLAGVGQVVITK